MESCWRQLVAFIRTAEKYVAEFETLYLPSTAPTSLVCRSSPMKKLYLIAAILGAALPLSQLIPFLTAHGLNLKLLFTFLFSNGVSGFFGMDVIVSSVVLWIFVFSEGRRLGMRRLWVYVVCNLAVGVSLALPLFLLFRERALDSKQQLAR